MIEINLFEQKKRNVLPHILLIILFVGLVGVGGYAFGAEQYYSSADASNIEKISAQNDEANQMRRIESIEDQVNRTQSELDQLHALKYPTVFLSDEIHDVIDNPEEIIESYRFNEETGIFLALAPISLEESTEHVRTLKDLPFVSHVDILTIFLVDPENELYQAELQVEISESLLREEWTADEN